MECFDCHSKNVVLNGNYKVYQKYKCKDCNKQFSERSFSFFCRHRFPEKIISNAILLSHFISTRIVKYFFRQNNVKLSHVSVYNWSKRFDKKLSKLKSNVSCINYTNIWHVDEKFVKVADNAKNSKGKVKFSYLWVVSDSKRNIVAVYVSHKRNITSATIALKLAKKNAKFNPIIIVTDGCTAYDSAIRRVFGRKAKHIKAHFEAKGFMHKKRLYYLSNNTAESLNSKINLWYKRFRGFKSLNSANLWCNGWMYFYNLLRPRVYQEEKIAWKEVMCMV